MVLEIAPEMKSYFIESTHDDAPGVLQAIGIKPKTWQYFLTGSGMVGVINSILVGVFGAIAVQFAAAALDIYFCVGIGVALFAVSVFLHHKLQLRRFTEVGERIKMRFPKDSKKGVLE